MQGDLSYAALDVLECEDISHTCQHLAPSALAARLGAPRYGWKQVTRGYRTQRPQGPERLGEGTVTPRANPSPSSLTAFLPLAETSGDLKNAPRTFPNAFLPMRSGRAPQGELALP